MSYFFQSAHSLMFLIGEISVTVFHPMIHSVGGIIRTDSHMHRGGGLGLGIEVCSEFGHEGVTQLGCDWFSEWWRSERKEGEASCSDREE